MKTCYAELGAADTDADLSRLTDFRPVPLRKQARLKRPNPPRKKRAEELDPLPLRR